MIARINISLEKEVLENAKSYANNTGRTLSGLISFLLGKWIKEEDFYAKQSKSNKFL